MNAGYVAREPGWRLPEPYRAFLRTKRPDQTLRCREPDLASGGQGSGEGFYSWPPAATDACAEPFLVLLRQGWTQAMGGDYPTVRDVVRGRSSLGPTVSLVEFRADGARYLGMRVPSVAVGILDRGRARQARAHAAAARLRDAGGGAVPRGGRRDRGHAGAPRPLRRGHAEARSRGQQDARHVNPLGNRRNGGRPAYAACAWRRDGHPRHRRCPRPAGGRDARVVRPSRLSGPGQIRSMVEDLAGRSLDSPRNGAFAARGVVTR